MEEDPQVLPAHIARRKARLRAWIIDLLMVLVLLAGASLRLVGVDWDQNKHLHPDERFLTMVETAIQPVHNLSEYFDTAHSSLNPQNRGYGFFVYGTLPVFLVRYVAEWTGMTGFDQVNLVGRQLSALVDVFTVLLVFLIGSRLYNRRVGVLAAAFSAFAVLQIQLSHYFTVDTFSNFFTFLAFYFAVRVLDHIGPRRPDEDDATDEVEPQGWYPGLATYGLFALFGIALGLAMASKINAATLAAVLPLALAIRLSREPRGEWRNLVVPAFACLMLAGVVSFTVFRIFQPYAFAGPGILDVRLNPKWLANLRELSAQSSGDVDAPFALQWTNRPIWFAWLNQVAWGLGWPLGLLAWAGFLGMGWRMVKGEWRQHGLIWVWTGAYFVWQSVSLTRAMRYQLLIYPPLAIMAAWVIIRLWDAGMIRKRFSIRRLRFSSAWFKWVALVLATVVLILTAAWAFAFSRIYTRPLTRVDASYWFYQNIPGPVELPISTSSGAFNQQLGYHDPALLSAERPYILAFTPEVSGELSDVQIEHVMTQAGSGNQTLDVSLANSVDFSTVLSTSTYTDAFSPGSDSANKQVVLSLDVVVPVDAAKTYYLKLDTPDPGTVLQVSGVPTLTIQTERGPYYQTLRQVVVTIAPERGVTLPFTAQESGRLDRIFFSHIIDQSGTPGEKTFQATLTPLIMTNREPVVGQITADFSPGSNVLEQLGHGYTLTFSRPVDLVKGNLYSLAFTLSDGQGALALYGSQVAKESDWDDDVPQPLPGYVLPGDVYQVGAINLQLYWPDDPGEYTDPRQDKLTRLLTNLDRADTIVITSNRQWGSITRVPQRYPLTTAYYRDLIGCPPGKSVGWCYSVAQPGQFQGGLGFKLEKVFQSNPNIDGVQINDQFAEEAFTVYDHPKVFIFRKQADYNQAHVAQALAGVDLTHVLHILPSGKVIRGTPAEKTLLLPAARWVQDQATGSWSVLFKRISLINSSPYGAMVIWYLVVWLLGWLVYPIVRLALPGLPDRGYPLARMTGLLLFALITWTAGSQGLIVTRLSLTIVIGLIALAGLLLAFLQRRDLRREWSEKRGYFLAIEIIAVLLFALDLLIRLGNPDLWHPSFGGEKPMDFSFFNAILKSATFPPYDPWFAGGYINYYYYGFVIAGMLVKWLGIIPSVAYNLILPTWFMLLGLGAFSLGWNLMGGRKGDASFAEDQDPELRPRGWRRWMEPLEWRSFQIGLAALIGFLILGNLGTVRMIWYGIQMLVASADQVLHASFIQHWVYTIQGLPRLLTGSTLPYYPGDWYWKPSRAIIPEAGSEITEFPFFTILYADPHAHLFALPVTLLVLGWALSTVLSQCRWGEPDGGHRWLSFGLSFIIGAIAIGALYPTNTWDYYTYLAFGGVALVYVIARYSHPHWHEPFAIPTWLWRAAAALLGAALLVGLSRVIYQPFYSWFGQAYNSLEIWKGNHTLVGSYLTHWGVFLFVIISWMFWETRDWMASTPLRSLRLLRPYEGLIEFMLFILVMIAAALVIIGIHVAWLVLPLAAWALILIFRPGQPDAKRFVLFMVGTALAITLMVELVRVKGDINRMNTVFKFYLQAWTLMAISAAAGLGWLVSSVKNWNLRLERTWQVVFT
ncbi:MAG: DUF2298 domain-containing protein, partial [Anaerolineaceae bacterium]|nr:DUF2298 domain-containing protein [Anaerolineaceae bacterium]